MEDKRYQLSGSPTILRTIVLATLAAVPLAGLAKGPDEHSKDWMDEVFKKCTSFPAPALIGRVRPIPQPSEPTVKIRIPVPSVSMVVPPIQDRAGRVVFRGGLGQPLPTERGIVQERFRRIRDAANWAIEQGAYKSYDAEARRLHEAGRESEAIGVLWEYLSRFETEEHPDTRIRLTLGLYLVQCGRYREGLAAMGPGRQNLNEYYAGIYAAVAALAGYTEPGLVGLLDKERLREIANDQDVRENFREVRTLAGLQSSALLFLEGGSVFLRDEPLRIFVLHRMMDLNPRNVYAARALTLETFGPGFLSEWRSYVQVMLAYGNKYDVSQAHGQIEEYKLHVRLGEWQPLSEDPGWDEGLRN